MPDGLEAPKPVPSGPSLTGFYVALGAAAALVGLGAWLWTPARIWYWEREVRRGSPWNILVSGSMGVWTYSGPPVDAARKLVGIGPRAGPAVSRLILSPESRHPVLQAVGDSRAQWVLPVLANACRKEADPRSRIEMVVAAQELSGVNFGAWSMLADADLEKPYRSFLDWWDREGRARYEQGGR